MLFGLCIVLGVALYVFRCSSNPPGFFVDESSIAYNAHTISQTGKDENGISWPLFFKAFGDYKNPVYIYLLALLFKITGPSILAARLQSAIAGVLAAILLGLLARRLARDAQNSPTTASTVGLLVMTSAFLTPWLFEISRVVLEVALYPLIVVLFLFCIERASRQRRWAWSNTLGISLTLALLTYSYSIGRLLAPLLAFGLILFANRERWPDIIRTWAIYLVTLVPLIVYQVQHEGALTERFNLVTNIRPEDSWLMSVWIIVKHYLGNIDPRRLFLLGDPNIYQVTHLYGKPAFLIATLPLLLIGVWRVLRIYPTNSWWRFVVYGAAVSVVPASLTIDYLHQLRLAALPVFLLILTVPALTWLLERKTLLRNAFLVIITLSTVAQGLAFQIYYQNSAASPWRRNLFDADYPEKIFNLAISNGTKPFYVLDPRNTPYIQAYWYGALHHFARTDLIRVGPEEIAPAGATVIANDETCAQKNLLSQSGPYVLYIADQLRLRQPLPDDAFRAEIVVLDPPVRVRVGEKIELNLSVKNKSEAVLPGCQHGPRDFQIYVGGHWLDSAGQHWLKEEGRAPLPRDLAPGQSTSLTFSLNSPDYPGEYVIELDLVQERVSWFGPKGSQPTKVKIHVE